MAVRRDRDRQQSEFEEEQAQAGRMSLDELLNPVQKQAAKRKNSIVVHNRQPLNLHEDKVNVLKCSGRIAPYITPKLRRVLDTIISDSKIKTHL
jgi:hypothetical protein